MGSRVSRGKAVIRSHGSLRGSTAARRAEGYRQQVGLPHQTGSRRSCSRVHAHVVAQDFTLTSLKLGVDYDVTSTPVATLSSLRATLALSAELHRMDVKVAYLNAELGEEILH